MWGGGGSFQTFLSLLPGALLLRSTHGNAEACHTAVPLAACRVLEEERALPRDGEGKGRAGAGFAVPTLPLPCLLSQLLFHPGPRFPESSTSEPSTGMYGFLHGLLGPGLRASAFVPPQDAPGTCFRSAGRGSPGPGRSVLDTALA